MASKGLRAISYPVTRKVEAGYKHSQTTETLIGYIVCCQPFIFQSFNSSTPTISPFAIKLSPELSFEIV